jgi:AraC-like DNA-binding protein
MSSAAGFRLTDQMTISTVDSSALERLLKTARRLLAQRGPNVTLSEVGRHAGIGCGVDGSTIVVKSLLEQRLGDLLEAVRSLPDPALAPIERGAWSDAVREVLGPQLDRPLLSLRTVARMLAVSPRTLQRRLAEEGTSWRGELDAARSERAAQLLRQGFTQEVTATRVGYSGSRALRRALRRWDGMKVDASGPQVVSSGPPSPCSRLA